jgi:hypothetical protein
MSRIDDEIKFLKRFRNRFDTRSEWIAALADMLDEGMITRVAYEEAIKKSILKKTSPIKKKSSPKSIVSGCDKPIDPCGIHAIRYDSCSSNKSSC